MKTKERCIDNIQSVLRGVVVYNLVAFVGSNKPLWRKHRWSWKNVGVLSCFWVGDTLIEIVEFKNNFVVVLII
jgi:hypothetical protein